MSQIEPVIHGWCPPGERVSLARVHAYRHTDWSVNRNGPLLLVTGHRQDRTAPIAPVSHDDHLGLAVEDGRLYWQDLGQIETYQPRSGFTLLLPRQLIEPLLPRLPIGHDELLHHPARCAIATDVANIQHLARVVPTTYTAALLSTIRLLLMSLTVSNDTQSETWLRVSTYLIEHLGDPDLDAAHLTTSLGLSRSALYRLFEHSGGVHQDILRRRLRLAHHLIRATPSAIPIVRLAERAGFDSPEVFWRSFRRAYGAVPGSLSRAEAISGGRDQTGPTNVLTRELHHLYLAGQQVLDNQLSSTRCASRSIGGIGPL